MLEAFFSAASEAQRADKEIRKLIGQSDEAALEARYRKLQADILKKAPLGKGDKKLAKFLYEQAIQQKPSTNRKLAAETYTLLTLLQPNATPDVTWREMKEMNGGERANSFLYDFIIDGLEYFYKKHKSNELMEASIDPATLLKIACKNLSISVVWNRKTNKDVANPKRAGRIQFSGDDGKTLSFIETVLKDHPKLGDEELVQVLEMEILADDERAKFHRDTQLADILGICVGQSYDLAQRIKGMTHTGKNASEFDHRLQSHLNSLNPAMGEPMQIESFLDCIRENVERIPHGSDPFREKRFEEAKAALAITIKNRRDLALKAIACVGKYKEGKNPHGYPAREVANIHVLRIVMSAFPEYGEMLLEYVGAAFSSRDATLINEGFKALTQAANAGESFSLKVFDTAWSWIKDNNEKDIYTQSAYKTAHEALLTSILKAPKVWGVNQMTEWSRMTLNQGWGFVDDGAIELTKKVLDCPAWDETQRTSLAATTADMARRFIRGKGAPPYSRGRFSPYQDAIIWVEGAMKLLETSLSHCKDVDSEALLKEMLPWRNSSQAQKLMTSISGRAPKSSENILNKLRVKVATTSGEEYKTAAEELCAMLINTPELGRTMTQAVPVRTAQHG